MLVLGRDAEEQIDDVHHLFGAVEWVTIFFLVGLFIVVSGIEHAGLLEIPTSRVISATGGDMSITAIVIFIQRTFLSAIVAPP